MAACWCGLVVDPKAAAPLTDAALTPYHAIKGVLPALTPDSTVLMIGIGGLGHMGVQILRAMCAARLVAADLNEAKLEFARQHGAVATVNTRSQNAAEEILASMFAYAGTLRLQWRVAF